jgi:hypothetical protein
MLVSAAGNCLAETTPAVPRYHALDAPRGVMMLGGVVLHAFCA